MNLILISLLVLCITISYSLPSSSKRSSVVWPSHPTSCWSNESGHGGDDCLHRHNPNPGVVPNITVYNGVPVLVKTVKNGKLYRGGGGIGGEDVFNIVHLWSSNSSVDNFYEMGEAYGQLLPDEFADMFARIEPWLAILLEGAVPRLPKFLAKMVVDLGAGPVLDILKDLLKKNIPTRYYQEWEGIQAGCKSVGKKCTIDEIARVSLFAQISKAACTAFVANTNATVNGQPMHLRALDFNASSYVADFATVTVYHYNTMPQYTNFGYTAMTDCLTCSNSLHMSIGEKMWGGYNTLIPLGLPWQMMLRESMEKTSMTEVKFELFISISPLDKNFIQAESIAPPGDSHIWPKGDMNTVSIHVAISDGTTNSIAGAEIGFNYSQWFDWNTGGPTQTHPNFPGIVYWPKNSNPHTMCPAEMISHQYGSIDGNWMANYYAYGDMTGDTQIVAWDHDQHIVYYANSRKSNGTGPLCAYFRQRTRLDMNALYSEKRP